MIDVSLKNVIDEKYAFVQLAESGNYHYGNSPETFGIISNAGKILLKEGLYKKIDKINSSFFTAIDQEGKYDIIDADGRTILSKCNTISLSGLVVTYSAAQESGKMNLADGRKAVVVKDKEIWSPSKASKISYEDPFVVWIDEFGKEHWLTLLGKPVFEEYDEVKTISKGCYVVSKNGKNAIASSSGDILTDWVDAVIPIMEDYVQMAVKRRYGQVCCAIYRASTKKMITGYDFAWVYTPKAKGLVPVKLLRGDNFGKTDNLLKMMGDFFYIAGVKNYTQVWDNWGQTFYIDKKGKIADPDKIMREAYDAQRQSSWY